MRKVLNIINASSLLDFNIQVVLRVDLNDELHFKARVLVKVDDD